MADSVLNAGADDYLHRPFTRAELIARTRAGLRAAEQRANDRLLRTLMENVPGAIYRSAWHADFVLEAISDEIERISGYPPAGFLASTKRTILSIVHPDDVDVVLEAVSRLDREPRAVRARVPDRARRRRGALGARPRPAGARAGRAAVAGRRAVRHHRAARGRGRRCWRTRSRRRARRSCAPRASASSRPPTRRGARSSATCTTARSSGSCRWCSTSRSPSAGWPRTRRGAAEFLERLGTELQEASAELRELARGIHPAVLTERGLVAAIGALATRSPFPVEVVDPPPDRFPPAIEATAYFTVAEALTNVAKYAQASHAVVRVACEGTDLVVEVARRRDRRRVDRLGQRAERARRPRRRQRRHAERREPRRARGPACARCCRSTARGRLERVWPATIGWSIRAPTATCARPATRR